MASSRPHLIRQPIALSAVIAFVVLGSAFVGGLLLIENDFQPEGGPFGLPTRIQTYGGLFERDPGEVHVLTMAQVEARRAEVETCCGLQPLTILEPTIGKVPLFAEVASGSGLQVFLHEGPDQYIEFDARP